jgi:hypothetical protein
MINSNGYSVCSVYTACGSGSLDQISESERKSYDRKGRLTKKKRFEMVVLIKYSVS